MKLEEMIRDTDALTYLNALKRTLVDIKEEFSEMQEQLAYQKVACEKTQRLLRKADNQYRLLYKLIQKDAPLTSNISIDGELDEIPEIKELMGDV